MFEKIRKKAFQVITLHHAEAILIHDMAHAVEELQNALLEVKIPAEELVKGGGGEGEMTQRLRRALADDYGWKKHNFEIKKIVDGVEKESISHEIDHVKTFSTGTFALEIEWNNKDPFFDRDLENFKRLHADGVISIGAIITRGSTLQARNRFGNWWRNLRANAALRTLTHYRVFTPPRTAKKISSLELLERRVLSKKDGLTLSCQINLARRRLTGGNLTIACVEASEIRAHCC